MIEEIKGRIIVESPLSHIDKGLGITSKFRRIPLLLNGEIERIPVFSGNAIRGILRRRLGQHFLRTINYEEKDLGRELSHILLRGGFLKGTTSRDTDYECTIKKTIPMLSLFGTAISNYGILRGKLEVGQAIPITKETEGITGIKSEVSIFQILNKVPHTHMDDSKQRDKIDKAKEKSEVQMRYYDEVMIPGTQLYHYFILRDCSELEKSCFWTAINEFNKYPRLGGNSRIGMGKVRWDYEIGDTKLYEDYLKENKKEIFKVFKMIYSKFKPILKRDAKFKEAVEKSIKNKE